MAQNKPVTIKATDSTKDILDVNFLKEQGIESIQKLSGKKWTDYNIHDPGITILEILCFALTELGFRSGYDVHDLFAETVHSSSANKDTSYVPHEILSSGSITHNDFLKIFLDIKGVNNIEIIKSKKLNEFSGVFDVFVELSDTNASKKEKENISVLIRSAIDKNRMLCIDIDEIVFFKTDAISLDLTIEVAKKVNQSDFIFQIVSSLEHYFSPSPNYSTLSDMLREGFSIEDIFSGPLLNNGFVKNVELQSKSVRKNIYVSDMVNFLMDIDEVDHIKKIQLYDDSDHNYNWLYSVKSGCIPRLNYEKTKLTVTYKGNTSHTLFLNELFSSNVPLYSVKGKSHKKNKIDPIKGEVKDLKYYNSILNDFPVVYGVGQYGLPDGGGDQELAQTNQLRTFMFFFDQILANYFAKLDGLKDLFSLNNIATTNPVQLLIDFPGVHYCYKPFMDEYLKNNINLKDENHIKKEWKKYLLENESYLTGIVQNSVENRSSYLKRRNKVLDHLLSRFGYSLVSFEFFAQLTSEELIKYKIDLLKELVFVGQNKYKGSSALDSSIFEKSGFDLYLGLLLGIQNPASELITKSVTELLQKNSQESNLDIVSISFKNQNLSESIANLFFLGCDKENYQMLNKNLLISGGDDNLFSKIKFNSNLSEENLIERTYDKLYSLSRESEGFYTIEHIGLRPNDMMRVFGFSVLQKDVAIFSSLSNYNREKRDDLLAAFLETSMKNDSFSVVEIELNQFKILWKNGKDEIFSTHFFESETHAKSTIKKYIQRFRSKDFTQENIIRETKYKTFYNEIEDPFSNLISFIIPSWPHRFQNKGFKKYINELFHSESPAHVYSNICWMNYEDMLQLENAYDIFMKLPLNKPEEKEKALDKLLSLLIQNE